MREIKFRAWDNTMNVMTKSFMLYANGTVYNDSGWDEPHVGEVMCERLVVMQYTGLKDRNGVEIYEGDIVKSLMSCAKYVICWSEENSAWYKQMIRINVSDRPVYQDGRSQVVIGNIYENPELLEQQ